LGSKVTRNTNADANLYHDMLPGNVVADIIPLCNQTLIDWYSKRLATVHRAKFGSEFTTARIEVNQKIDLRTRLRYQGVPVNEESNILEYHPTFLFEKRQIALAYNCVRAIIAAEILAYYGIDGKNNPSEIVFKNCGYQKVWYFLKLSYSNLEIQVIFQNL
jgi:hypothetical protein